MKKQNQINNVLFATEKDREVWGKIKFFAEVELDDTDDDVVYPAVRGEGKTTKYRFFFGGWRVPDTTITSLVQKNWEVLLAREATLTVKKGKLYLEIGKYRSRGENEVVEEEGDEMDELRTIFTNCALTEDEAGALGFGPGPHFPDQF